MTQQLSSANGLLDWIFGALDDCGVRWVLLRGRATLGSPGRDVDILVDAADIPSLQDVVFELGGMALPRSMHPWHRFYRFGVHAGEGLTLDVVSGLIYGRDLRVSSDLESGCLDRRVRDGKVYVLDPTDMFWTVLLHCVLDKQNVNERRGAELEAVVRDVVRPSPGEKLFEGLCPAAWSADRAIAAVSSGDWDALAGLGREISPRPSGADGAKPRSASTGLPRRATRAAATAIYPVLWRRAGLGVTPHVLDTVEATCVAATVTSLRRRPGLCEITLLVPEADQDRLQAGMRQEHFRRVAGGWTRVTKTGLERVRMAPSTQLPVPGPTLEEVRGSASAMFERTHVRRAPSGTASSRSRSKRQVKVSFSGLDGAGKTRQIDALVAAVAGEHSVEVLWVPFKVWPEPLLNRLPPGFRSMLGPKRKTVVADAPSSQTDGHPETARRSTPAVAHVFRSAVWAGVGTVAAVSAGLSLRRRASRLPADVLVLDRYRLDSIVKLQFWYADVPGAWLTRVVRALAPAPDVEFLLRVSPEEAYARKPEQWTVEQLSRQARAYDRLAAGPLRVVTIDAHRDADAIAQEVCAHVRSVLDVG